LGWVLPTAQFEPTAGLFIYCFKCSIVHLLLIINIRSTEIAPEAGYRLCEVDEYGQLWTRPCAMAEILSVSQAIARYQQIKDLTDHKQKIELHIRQILEDLVHLRMKLED
jgi:hypothetical protein